MKELKAVKITLMINSRLFDIITDAISSNYVCFHIQLTSREYPPEPRGTFQNLLALTHSKMLSTTARDDPRAPHSMAAW